MELVKLSKTAGLVCSDLNAANLKHLGEDAKKWW